MYNISLTEIVTMNPPLHNEYILIKIFTKNAMNSMSINGPNNIDLDIMTKILK
jgi:hypothetical protein